MAVGAAGTSDKGEPENANASIDKFGGTSSLYKNSYLEKRRIGRSGECHRKDVHAGGAGFYASPSVEHLNKMYVQDLPKCFKMI